MYDNNTIPVDLSNYVEVDEEIIGFQTKGDTHEGGFPGSESGACLFNKQSILIDSKKRYSVLVNYKTHQTILIDQVKVRYHHMRKRVKNWCDLMAGVKNARLLMITLTYRPGEDWEPNDIREFILGAKNLLKNDFLGYAWVAELQERGVPHYHVLVWISKKAYFPFPDKSGLWKKGLSGVDKAISPYYVLKYVGKEKQKDFDKFPKGMRCFAVHISDIGMNLKLRFENLKDWEKGIVVSEGWEELSFWKRVVQGTSDWLYSGCYADLDKAKKEKNDWGLVFQGNYCM